MQDNTLLSCIKTPVRDNQTGVGSLYSYFVTGMLCSKDITLFF